MNDNIRHRTIDEFFQLLYLAMDFDKEKRSYNTEVDISSSEIYLLLRIVNTPKANVTTLAELLEISKSAVSQSIKKLRAKDLVTIDIDTDNQSRYIIGLSEKGKIAHKAHMEMRDGLSNKLRFALDKYGENTCKEMIQFFVESKDIFNDFV